MKEKGKEPIDRIGLIHDLIQILHDDVCAPGGHLDPYFVFEVIKKQPILQPTCNQLAIDCKLVASWIPCDRWDGETDG